jgi:hypothetical protein
VYHPTEYQSMLPDMLPDTCWDIHYRIFVRLSLPKRHPVVSKNSI